MFTYFPIEVFFLSKKKQKKPLSGRSGSSGRIPEEPFFRKSSGSSGRTFFGKFPEEPSSGRRNYFF